MRHVSEIPDSVQPQLPSFPGAALQGTVRFDGRDYILEISGHAEARMRERTGLSLVDSDILLRDLKRIESTEIPRYSTSGAIDIIDYEYQVFIGILLDKEARRLLVQTAGGHTAQQDATIWPRCGDSVVRLNPHTITYLPAWKNFRAEKSARQDAPPVSEAV